VIDLMARSIFKLIGRMVDAVAPWDRFVIKRMRASDTSQINAAQQWVRPCLMMRVDATGLAKIVLRCVGSKTVQT
jgi:hypothetical protein